ncbi:P-loop containing nucleoside triphosphate hydrolase protein [Cantharellus anzutake]|uniref:P-loop containing nucleoside triphosphate hydrolase protein n=1 Tax=Cantharellus anzutake TaxID=1750568 RepID=UPI001907F784|nr:P-loop containing nucleoside triphosphate hydrolase protein [Cantharellus anzutake]KAF8310908.1 P-loop containing nucleoside triphosphate hydrolase protein [Cantharellus anzutake]
MHTFCNNNTRRHSGRIIIGVCGIPASGKTTLANAVVGRINELYRAAPHKSHTGTSDGATSPNIAICVGQDGWHLPRSALDKFENVKLAYDRRGAAFTFDGAAFSTFVLSLRLAASSKDDAARSEVITSSPMKPQDGLELSVEEPVPPGQEVNSSPVAGILPRTSSHDQFVVRAPSFSHTLKDPTPDAISIYPYHRIVIIEGLYTFLDVDPWDVAARALDERWYIDVDEAEGKRRLIARHVVTGVAKDYEEAVWRAENNDIPNGQFIKEHMLEPTRVIRSINDRTIAAQSGTE